MPAKKGETVVFNVKEINMQSMVFFLEGNNLGVSRFSFKAQKEMENKQKQGQAAKSSKVREERNFEEDYKNAKYVSEDGWYGVNASCFRNAMISVCRVAGVVMTRAKLAIFIKEDGLDATDGTPLVRIYGEPEMWIAPARNADGGIDLRCRAKWRRWRMRVHVEFDADVVSAQSVTNLMVRVGKQAGICEGRHDSRKSAGIGMGTFRVIDPFDVDDDPFLPVPQAA